MIWTLYNVKENDKITIDSTDHVVGMGYYTFDDLKEYLEGKNCVVTLEKSGKCTITPPSSKTLHLKNLGPLLGFNEKKSLNAKETSPYIVNIHQFNTISIFCNKVNTYRNFDMGKRSEKLSNIFVPTGNLWGTTSEHFIETSVDLENGEMSSIQFTVTDNSFLTDKDSYSMNLDCEIL